MSTDNHVMVSIVGNSTGDGDAPIPSGTMAVTPDHQPNLLVQVVPPIVAIIVRAINLFLTTLVGLLTAAGIGVDSFNGDVHTVIGHCITASLIVAGMGTLKNCITIFSRLEGKFPIATGSI